jgi:hypothetical protein
LLACFVAGFDNHGNALSTLIEGFTSDRFEIVCGQQGFALISLALRLELADVNGTKR